MSEREAFKKVLKENPLDDAARLVFSDWLEENGFDDEAVRMRQWRAAYDYMVKIAAVAGGSCVEYVDMDDGSYDTEEVSDYTVEDMIEAGQNYLEHGDFLTQVGHSSLRDYVDRKEYWKNWEIVTGVTPPKTDKWGYDIGIPFSCSC